MIVMLVRDENRIERRELESGALQPPLQLLQVEAVVDQNARGEKPVASLHHQCVASAARSETADAQHQGGSLRQRNWSFSSARIRSPTCERSGLPSLSYT